MAITNTPTEQIVRLAAAQKQYFRTGQTLDISYRLTALKALKAAILKHEKSLTDALWADLHKSKEEAILTELSIVSGEVKNHLRHRKSWMRRSCRTTPLKMTPSYSRLVSEPLGNALIMSPWNYPEQL